MSKKMSTLFHEFIHDNDLNGNDEIIRETNAVVAEDDIEAGTMLDDRVGEKYFYKCMELAENVIKSFEDEQPELNENQQVVLDWLKEDYSKNRWTSPFGTIYGAIRQHESQIRILPQEQQAQVLQAFSCWAIEQEEE